MKLEFTETVLRDANQSLIATRMPLSSFETILDTIDKAGYYSVECWGGATFDACIRYLNEDPWERLKLMRKAMPNTKLQMLLRGQSLLGYKFYPDDVVRKFIYNSVEKGIDIIRIFDALNDVNNLAVSIDETLKCGAHPSCAICYTQSPVHNIKKYIEIAISMVELGAKSICIKDMAGILPPNIAYELVSSLKEKIDVPIILHSHCTTGLAPMTYLKAVEAGADIIDTAISSFSGGTSQPATETMATAFQGMGYHISLDMEKLAKINEHFLNVRKDFFDKGKLSLRSLSTTPKILECQIPGGMYSNLIEQLKSQDMIAKLDAVLAEVPRVRKDLGYPPLVTPISQMIGVQATMNVISGERYKDILKEIKAYFKGEYGIPPGPVNSDLMIRITGGSQFSSIHLNQKSCSTYNTVKKQYKEKQFGRSDILTTILYPDIGLQFVTERQKKHKNQYLYSITSCKDKDYNVNDFKIFDQKDINNEEIVALILAIIANETKIPVSNIKNEFILQEIQ